MASPSLLHIKRFLKRVWDLKGESLQENKKIISTPFKVKDFRSLSRIEQWIDNGLRPTVFTPGCGKTQFANKIQLEAVHREGVTPNMMLFSLTTRLAKTSIDTPYWLL